MDMEPVSGVRAEEVGTLVLQDNSSEAYEPTLPSYDEVFPALPESNVIESQQKTNMGQWSQRMKVNSSVITQVFRVPVEERRYKEINEFGGQGEQAKICADIMQKAGAHIEISSSKDQTLTILVTGKQEAVVEARRQIVNALQTEANISVPIPKEHHRFVLGKSGKKLKELEQLTTTKISVPRAEDNSDLIRILGTRENIDKARHEIQIISDEQAKLAFERLEINSLYHPFIAGANNENVARIMEENAVRINIPPRSLNKDELTIAGEKDGVMKAKEIIIKIYDEKKRKCQTVSINVSKPQHRYIIGYRGSGIQDILAQTGVSVEVPPTDNPLDTITLRGEHDKLGPALTLVYAKANSVVESEVDAPSWLHKYIIGKKGANIRQMMQDSPDVQVQFNDAQDKILIKGPPDEVEVARKSLEAMAKDLVSRITYEEIKVEPKYHKHIIGKSGVNVNRIKQETGVLISIPTNETSNTIRIEGSVQGVATAKRELNDLVLKMENELTKEIQIDQRFHRAIIGSKGESIRETRERFNQVNIAFPDPGIKSDTVSIRGAKADVEMCYRYLASLNKELIESNHRIEVPIYKQFHKYIIGKGGANIKKIRDETDTKIDLPAEGSESDVIVITGKRDNAELARERVQAIQNEQANIVSADISIPAKFHNSIIGAKGRLIRSIMDECGGVSVRFPPEGGGSDKVTIRGPKEDVDKAKKQLMELSNEKQISSFSAEVRAKPEHHRFLIGKNGGNIKKVRDKTGARIIFPSEKDPDREIIVIMGKKESVQEAKTDLEELIRNLDKIVEAKIHVDPRHHRHFVARRGQVLRDIANEYGGVTVSFPRNGDQSDVVVLKGAKDCVEDAKNRIEEIVIELEKMVTMECIIPQKFHRTVMGVKGTKVQNVTQEFDVQIKFPDREAPRDDEYHENGEIDENVDVGVSADSQPRKSDVIRITGKRENCEKAKEALLSLVPITVEINVPFDFHRFIIGQKGRDIREMMEKYEVNIGVPPANEQSDIIRISGLPGNVENAQQALQDRVGQLEEKKLDMALRSFQVKVEVDPKHHPKIIGRGGKVIGQIRGDHSVQIQFPERGNAAENMITITGYEKSAEAAKDDILKIVSDLEGLVSEDVVIDHRVHSRLIGQRGRHIRKIMEDYKVDIRFMRDSDGDPDQVVVTGAAQNVQDVKDHLLNLEEEYLQEMTDQESLRQYRHSSSRQQEEDRGGDGGGQTGFVVKGGPWEQKPPDTSSSTDFPSFRGAKETQKLPVVWGPRH